MTSPPGSARPVPTWSLENSITQPAVSARFDGVPESGSVFATLSIRSTPVTSARLATSTVPVPSVALRLNRFSVRLLELAPACVDVGTYCTSVTVSDSDATPTIVRRSLPTVETGWTRAVYFLTIGKVTTRPPLRNHLEHGRRPAGGLGGVQARDGVRNGVREAGHETADR